MLSWRLMMTASCIMVCKIEILICFLFVMTHVCSGMAAIKIAELRPAFVYLHQHNKTTTDIAKLFNVHRKTVRDAIARYNETGSHKNRKGSGRPRTATSRRNQCAVMVAISKNPSSRVNSARKLGRRLGISRRSVQRILRRDLRLFPYKLKTRQFLSPENIKKRLRLCTEFRRR